MNKKTKNQEVIDVLNIISSSAKHVLKNVKKRDMSSINEAEEMLEKLKSAYSESMAAE